MPTAVHALAKAMTPSRVLAMGHRPSGQVTRLSPKTGMHASAHQTPFLSNQKTKQHAVVASAKYAWGARLTAGMLKAAGIEKPDAKRYTGMVKMDTSTPGGTKSSSYMTFRIMMDSQTGKWVIPPQPGQYLVKKVVEELAPKAEQAFAAAVSKTVIG
jgi:steroid 5-alpha reductase family enzyme